MSTEQDQLKKIGNWVLVVFLLIVLGNLAVFGVRYYFVQRAVDDLNMAVNEVTADMTARSQAFQQKQRVEAQKRAQIELDRETLCALNNDTGVCVCIHRQTGQPISLTHDDCVNRAQSTSTQ